MKDQTNMVGILLPLLLLGALAAPADAIEWRQGTVTFSSDRTVNGKVYVLRDSLYVYDLASQERRNVAVGNIKRIEMVVRDEKMAKKWYFKESGSDEKIYTGDRYPVRRFYVRITFHDGSTLRGKPISRTVYVQTEEGREHYKLGQKQEGEVGQKLKDLVYLESITFAESGQGVTGSITASIRPPSAERIQRTVALNTEQNFIREGKSSDGRVEFPRCTTGTYDLLVATDRALYAAFSAEGANAKRRLDTRQVADIQQWIDKLEDFYTTQRVLYAAGSREKAFVLVFRERNENIHGPTALVRRYDVWVMHKPRNQWQIKKRIGIFRMATQKTQAPRRELVVNPTLAGHRIDKDHTKRQLNIRLKKGAQTPIPEAGRSGPVWPRNESDDGRKNR